jgi:hypothetical protein
LYFVYPTAAPAIIKILTPAATPIITPNEDTVGPEGPGTGFGGGFGGLTG